NTVEAYGRTRVVSSHAEPFGVRKGVPACNSLPPSFRTIHRNVWPATVAALDGERLVIGTTTFNALVTSSLRLDTSLDPFIGYGSPSFMLVSKEDSISTQIVLDTE
ncbi:hypothetical protein EDD21DRAFT_288504, partial [Dissophora ornata]